MQTILAKPTWLVVLTLLLANLQTGCARKALVADKFPEEFYRIPALLPPGDYGENPTFIVIGDSRPGWRAVEKFARKRNWATWWMLAVPFYQVYWVGNGLVGGFNYVRHVPDYGDDNARRVRDDVYAAAGRADANFIVHLGDIATDGRRGVLYKHFVTQYKEEVPVVMEYPLLPIPGNHEMPNDTTYGLRNYESVFSYPRFYKIAAPDADLFFVDSDIIIDQNGFVDDDTQDRLFEQWFVGRDGGEPAWLQRELAMSDKAFRIVFMHHPPISFGSHYDDWGDAGNGRNLRNKRRRLLQLLQEYDVQVLFAGHQHDYEHNVVSAPGNVADAGDLHVVISGGAGSPLHPPRGDEDRRRFEADYAAEGWGVERLKAETTYNYCVVNVTENRITIDAYEVTSKPEDTGRILEHFVVERK